MTDAAPVLEVRDVSFAYGDTPVLSEVNLTIRQRDHLVILGPNGGGKTTLARLILGLLTPDRGTIVYLQPELRHRIGYVPQHSAFEQWFPLRVREVVRMGRLAQRGILRPFRREDNRLTDRMLESLQITDLAALPVGSLSGGQLQRVLIARALIAEPALLILDEPTASIDAESRTQLRELLSELNRRIPIVMITHDMTAVAADVRSIACVNRRLYYHRAGELSSETISRVYGCPVDLLAHGVPHRVLGDHEHPGEDRDE